MVAALLLAAGAGCSTAISTMQSAETLPKGKWHVGTGMDVSIPASRVGDLLDAAAAVEDRASDPSYVATDEDRKIYADAIIGIVLNAPGV